MQFGLMLEDQASGQVIEGSGGSAAARISAPWYMRSWACKQNDSRPKRGGNR